MTDLPHPPVPDVLPPTVSILKIIAGRYADLSAGHRSVADFILSSPHEAALMTLKDLARAAQVSEATANRFSGRLGLSGHPELKRMLHEELRDTLRSIESFGEVIAQARVSGDPWRMSLEDDAARVREIAPLGGWGRFALASSKLATARTVWLVGFGSSAFLAQYAEFCLSALRPGCRVLVDSSGAEGGRRRLLDAGPEDVALQIAFARYSQASLTVAQDLNALKVPIIGVTDSADSPLVPFNEISIVVPRKPGFVLTGAGAGAMAAIDALLRGAADVLGDDPVMRRSARLTSLLGPSVVTPASGT
jgi:DNA-binding MurR/RpiR family transcriptional regulator